MVDSIAHHSQLYTTTVQWHILDAYLFHYEVSYLFHMYILYGHCPTMTTLVHLVWVSCFIESAPYMGYINKLVLTWRMLSAFYKEPMRDIDVLNINILSRNDILWLSRLKPPTTTRGAFMWTFIQKGLCDPSSIDSIEGF